MQYHMHSHVYISTGDAHAIKGALQNAVAYQKKQHPTASWTLF